MPKAAEHDVVVVGAGPAGTAAAITLARAGLDVLIADKAVFPRDKCCGDGLTTNALRLVEQLGADPTRSPSWHQVDDVFVRSPSGRVAHLPLASASTPPSIHGPRERVAPPGGVQAFTRTGDSPAVGGHGRGHGCYGAVCRRAELDASLVRAANQAGAGVSENDAFVELLDRDDLTVRLERSGVVKCRYLIGADGIWSPVRRATSGASGYLGEWHAFRTYWSGVGAEAARHLWVWFDDAVLPGYAWSFPMSGGRANVGVTLLRRPGVRGAELRRSFDQVLDTPWLSSLLGRNAKLDGATSSWPIPTSPAGVPLTALAGRVLFVGDAARVADPLTGEGVGQALETGIAAAHAIVASSPDPVRTALQYETELRRTLIVDNRLAARLSNVLSSPIGARGAVRVVGANAFRRAFGSWLFEDYPRAALLTPHRWRHRSGGPAFGSHWT